ncbi:MAG: hypothetical protein AB1505_07835 [Candidatus Latescibacterota bacterium]
MNERIAALVAAELEADRLEKVTRHLAGIERTFCYARFAESAAYCAEEMRAAGLQDVRLTPLCADGETAYMDFVMPQAWDATGAELAILEPDGSATRLLDWERMPLCLANRSAPTPPGGLEAEVITARQLRAGSDAAGRFVYTEGEHAVSLRGEAAAAGAAGLIADALPARDIDPEATYWINGWCGPGWYQSRADPPLTCFSVSPAMGRLLALRLASGPVRVRARADTRLYDGVIHTVEGLIPGTTPREIVLLAHIYEPFPGDDAIGAAAVVEIARTLGALIARGALPAPTFGLRCLVGMERYGFAEYWERPEARQRAVLGISMDAIALSPALTYDSVEVRSSPASLPFWGDHLLWQAAQRLLAGYPLVPASGNLSDDTLFSDITIGVPSQWVWTRVGDTHHSSLWLREEANDWPLGAAIARLIATYVADLATAGPADLERFAASLQRGISTGFEQARSRWSDGLRAGELTPAQVQRQAGFLARWQEGRIRSLRRMYPQADAAPLLGYLAALAEEAVRGLPEGPAPARPALTPVARQARRLIVRRRSLGMPFSQARIPVSERLEGYYEQALNWADGTRNLLEIAAQVECETGRRTDDAWLARFIQYVRLMAQYGYLALAEGADP